MSLQQEIQRSRAQLSFEVQQLQAKVSCGCNVFFPNPEWILDAKCARQPQLHSGCTFKIPAKPAIKLLCFHLSVSVQSKMSDVEDNAESTQPFSSSISLF